MSPPTSKVAPANAGADRGEEASPPPLLARRSSLSQTLLEELTGVTSHAKFPADGSGDADHHPGTPAKEVQSGTPVTSTGGDDLIRDRRGGRILDPELLAQLKQPRPFSKTADKIAFVCGVLNALLAIALVFGDGCRWFLPYWTTACFVLLVGNRLRTYYPLKYQYFLFDYCYFAFALLLVYYWVLPESEEWSERVFTAAFVSACGPLLTAVALFRNSLVFHSLDKLTSCFLHIVPFLNCFAIRHFDGLKRGDRVVSGSKNHWNLHTPEDTISLGDGVLLGTGFYLCHLVFYLLLINVIYPLPKDPAYLTSYRYLLPRLKKALPLGKGNKGNPEADSWLYPVAYGLWNFLAAVLAFLPAPLLYYSGEAMCLWGTFFITWGIWNGGNYYIEVFGRGHY